MILSFEAWVNALCSNSVQRAVVSIVVIEIL